jgi:hypothetical protein
MEVHKRRSLFDMRRSGGHGGSSRAARKRREAAALLGKQLHYGDPDAAFRLLQRGRALKGIAKHGWRWRLELANAARLGKLKERRAAAAVEAEQRRLREEWKAASTQRRTSPWPSILSRGAQLNLYRARFGTGGVRGDYRDGQCRPVAPGGKCSVCAWTWGGTEPHPIAIP